jgi:enoyl-CoA hydratase/carnithine racemase
MANEFKTIIYEKDNRNVVTIILNRPNISNAMSESMKYEIMDALRRVRDDKEARILIFKGAGKSFCSGRDMNEVAEMGQPLTYFLDQLSVMIYNLMREVRIPIIVATKGWCLGVAFIISALSDIVVASDDTRFGMPEIVWDWLGPSVALYKAGVPLHVVKEIAWTADPLDAHRAERIGLANKTVPREKLDEEVENYVKKLLKIHPTSLILSKIAVEAAVSIPNRDVASAFERAVSTIQLTERPVEEFGVKRFKDKKEHVYVDGVRKV